MHLEPPLFVHVLVLVVCICHHHRSSQACSLIEKKSLVAYKKKKEKSLPEAQDTDISRGSPVCPGVGIGGVCSSSLS